MYRNKSEYGTNNICGKRIQELRVKMNPTVSQRGLADMLQIAGLDVDKNTVQRIESGQRFVSDIELKIIAGVLKVSCEELLK